MMDDVPPRQGRVMEYAKLNSTFLRMLGSATAVSAAADDASCRQRYSVKHGLPSRVCRYQDPDSFQNEAGEDKFDENLFQRSLDAVFQLGPVRDFVTPIIELVWPMPSCMAIIFIGALCSVVNDQLPKKRADPSRCSIKRMSSGVSSVLVIHYTQPLHGETQQI